MKLKQYLTEMFTNTEDLNNDTEILRMAITAELDAVVFYEQLARKTMNTNVKKVLLDVAKEEKVHVEEFEELLEKLDPDYEEAEEKAEEELEDMGIQ